MTPDTLPVPLPLVSDHKITALAMRHCSRVIDSPGASREYSFDESGNPGHTVFDFARACMAPLQERADALQAENALLKNAIEECFDTVQSMDWVDTDSDSACRRVALRRLNEAVGKALPRLLMERPEGQKLYALHWQELKARADALEEALRELATKAAALLYDLSEEHGDDHFEPECNICRSYKELSALVDGSLINPTGGESS